MQDKELRMLFKRLLVDLGYRAGKKYPYAAYGKVFTSDDLPEEIEKSGIGRIEEVARVVCNKSKKVK